VLTVGAPYLVAEAAGEHAKPNQDEQLDHGLRAEHVIPASGDQGDEDGLARHRDGAGDEARPEPKHGADNGHGHQAQHARRVADGAKAEGKRAGVGCPHRQGDA